MMKGIYDSDYFISMCIAVADNFHGPEAKLHETSEIFPKAGKAGPQRQRSRRGGMILFRSARSAPYPRRHRSARRGILSWHIGQCIARLACRPLPSFLRNATWITAKPRARGAFV
jgi:hypothetical protein